ncbi:BrnA antitoxin family protein [Candidatus Regiella insecticola]|uniref:BrnA antitoxin family protein n=1 Tax=Candidatus Regiella insecticola TaxID=138073 RepID=UPI0009DA9199|nr:BrnA antitoxin family protein [Candidatus Regiella insecticola]
MADFSFENAAHSRSSKSPHQNKITIRLSPEVVEQFRATGKHWQSRMDAAMKNWLIDHSPNDLRL